MQTVDCRKQQCPYPVVQARKLMLASPGEVLTVLVGDETARENVSRLAAHQGYQVREEAIDAGFALTLQPSAPAAQAVAAAPAVGKTVAFIGSDVMGGGSDELGRLLLRNFLFTMSEQETIPDLLLFVNAGVKLTASGSEVLEALDRLANKGADIASCGLCLDYFHLKDHLAAGRVTNMLEILEAMQQAGRLIRP
jgi:selenium metabolism protein YedF